MSLISASELEQFHVDRVPFLASSIKATKVSFGLQVPLRKVH